MSDDEEHESETVTIPTLRCLRCGHEWIPRKAALPKNCPGCNSPYWNKPRKVKKNDQ